MKIVKGDQRTIDVKISNPDDVDEIILTCREKAYKTSPMLFQKKISKGEFELQDDVYVAWIMREDTKDLAYGIYGLDLEVRAGKLILTKIDELEVTDKYGDLDGN